MDHSTHHTTMQLTSSYHNVREMTDRGTIQSVDRALELLELVAANPKGVPARELADLAGLPLPTAYHLLRTLVLRGYLERSRRTYQLGPQIPALGEAYERTYEPGPAAVEAMHTLAAQTGETVYLSRWMRGDVAIIRIAEGVLTVRVTGIHVGLRGQAHARASGKVLLAFGPPDRLDTFLSTASLDRLTPQTITDPSALRADAEEIRQRGYSIDREEYVEGVGCLAAPILDGSGYASLALTVTFPAGRLVGLVEEVSPLLIEAARAASGGSVEGE
jgi:IclR family acetate operon transcriptional repressor